MLGAGHEPRTLLELHPHPSGRAHPHSAERDFGALSRDLRRGPDQVHGEDIFWSKGDFLTFPAQSKAEHFADADTAAFYWVHDEPFFATLV